jgi:hypothetical protein
MAVTLPLALLAGAAGCDGGAQDEIDTEVSALTNGQLIYDWSTQCTAKTPDGLTSQQMHCCPDGFAMNGLYNQGGGVFKCFGFPKLNDTKLLDLKTQVTVAPLGLSTPTTTMHGCPSGTVMVGYHGSTGRLACQAYLPARGAIYNKWRDPSTQDEDRGLWTPMPPQMHTCMYRSNLMIGFHSGNGAFACLEESAAPPP